MDPISPTPIRKTILIVEDEDGVRGIMARMLQYFGYNVLTAADGKQGLDTFVGEKDAIDVVLLDWTLPKINGNCLLMKLLDEHPQVKVVITSGIAEGEIEVQYLSRVKGYIAKPYDVSQINHVLNRVLSA